MGCRQSSDTPRRTISSSPAHLSTLAWTRPSDTRHLHRFLHRLPALVRKDLRHVDRPHIPANAQSQPVKSVVVAGRNATMRSRRALSVSKLAQNVFRHRLISQVSIQRVFRSYSALTTWNSLSVKTAVATPRLCRSLNRRHLRRGSTDRSCCRARLTLSSTGNL